MSAENVAGWANIHGLRQNHLNEMKLTRGVFGQGYHDPTFSPENYIHKMFEKRPMLTRLHQLLRENIPGRIKVRFTKNGGLYIHITPFAGFSPYIFVIDNIYDFVVPPIDEYDVVMNRRNLGGYLPIRATVYRIVRKVAQEIQAAAVGEIYEQASNAIGHPQSGDMKHGPVGHIMKFMGGKNDAKKSRKNRKTGSSKTRK
jgi:hypothetical protein